MTDDMRSELDSDPLDVSEGLYHEAQADGVPYDESLEPFTRELPKLRS
jgi:hypothetical protein